MGTPALNDFEKEFAQLSTEAQLSLLERLMHQTRMAVTGRQDTLNAGLSAMAADPEIQRELSHDFALGLLPAGARGQSN